MNLVEIKILEYLHKMKKTIFLVLQSNGQTPDLESDRCGYSAEQEYIKEIISAQKSVFLGRLGSIELNELCNYLQLNGLFADVRFTRFSYVMDRCWLDWWSFGVKNGMKNNAGFFPAEDRYLDRWGALVATDLEELDFLLTWQKNELYVKPFMRNLKGEIDNYQVYYPIVHENPWTEILKDKKVLVVSPFSTTIEHQYAYARKHIHKNKNVLPLFDLQTIKAFNFLRGEGGGKMKSWFEALEIMEEQITEKNFDIALLSCGAYAFNLGAFIKRMGKTSITMCGGLPLLFGVYGNRYEAWLRKETILNETWVRPRDDEKPFGYQYVENAAYW